MEQYLLDRYSHPIEVVQPDTLLRDLQQRSLDDDTFLVLKDEDTWRLERYQNVMPQDALQKLYQEQLHLLPESETVPHPLDILTLADMPLLPEADAVFHESDDPDEIDEAVQSASEVAVLILRDSDDTPLTVLSDVHVGGTTKPEEDDDVQFTVQHPKQAAVRQKIIVTVYAHLPGDVPGGAITTIQDSRHEIRRQLPQTQRIRRGSRITVTLEDCDESILQYTPPLHRWRWRGQSLQMDFMLEVDSLPANGTVMFWVSVQIETIEIASWPVIIDIVKEPTQVKQTQPIPYHQSIFISYSRKDVEIARVYYQAQVAAANELFFDSESIDSGLLWWDCIKQAIEACDFMQLFWSQDSATSKNVRKEWEYFLESRCENDITNCQALIRPVYWKKPLAEVPDELSALNFKYVEFD